MSSTVKRSKASDKDGKRKASSSRSAKKGGKDTKSRRKAVPKDKKRRAPSSKKDTKKPKAVKSTKKAKHDDEDATEKPVKAPKISARKIEVEWEGRSKWAVRTQPFRRLVNLYAHEMTEKAKLPDMRLAAHVTKAIQSAVEEEMVELLRQASMMALHAKRTTVQKQDVSLTSRLSKPLDTKEADLTYASVLSKRSSKQGTDAKRAPSKPRVKKAAAVAAPTDGSAPAAAAVAGATATETKKKAAPKKGKKAAANATGQDASAVNHPTVSDAFPIAV